VSERHILLLKLEQNLERWIKADEAEDVAGSVRHALRCRTLISQDDQAWKWLALALHSALQGACVCHLVGTAPPTGAVTNRNANEWNEYFNKSRTDPKIKAPKTYLMALPELLKAIRQPHSAGDGSNTYGVRLTDAEYAWLTRFHGSIRNQFTHFEPMGWSIEVSGIPEIANLVSRIIGEILEMQWAFRHENQTWLNALRADLRQLASQTTDA